MIFLKNIVLGFFIFFSIGLFSQSNYRLQYEFSDINGHVGLSYVLINKNEAVFFMEDERESGMSATNNDLGYYVLNDKLSKFTYTNDKEIYTRIPYFNGELIYKFPSDSLDWQFTDEKRTIGRYNCQKATMQLHGREHEVWFTTEIPINFGPLRLNNLPGIVVEATIDGNFLSFKLLKIKKNELDNSKFDFYKSFFKEAKVHTYDAYEKLSTRLMTDSKRKKLAIVAEMAAKYSDESISVAFDEKQTMFTHYFIDIPDTVVNELKQLD